MANLIIYCIKGRNYIATMIAIDSYKGSFWANIIDKTIPGNSVATIFVALVFSLIKETSIIFSWIFRLLSSDNVLTSSIVFNDELSVQPLGTSRRREERDTGLEEIIGNISNSRNIQDFISGIGFAAIGEDFIIF